MSKLDALEEKGYFSPSATIRPLPHNMYELTDDLFYTWHADGFTRRIKVPKGFPYDGASIPVWGTFITWVLPWFETIHPMGAHWKAAAFHDWSWMYKGRVPFGTYDVFVGDKWVDISYVPQLYNQVKGGMVWTFESSNRLFGRHLKELGIGKKERNTMEWAVGTWFAKRRWNEGQVPEDARPVT